MIKPYKLGLLLVAGAFCTFANTQEYPQVVQQLVDDGVEIASSFEAPGGLTGYVGSIESQPVSFFMTDDEKYVLLGMMIDENGYSITDDKIDELVLKPMNQQAWQQLEDAAWILDGKADAPTIVYTFTDPNCPYCHRFRQQASPWIDAGLVQIRHIMVGIIRADSFDKAAVIVASENPAQALLYNQENHRSGGIKVDKKLAKEGQEAIMNNNQLMDSLGLQATPSTYYLDKAGNVQSVQGLPQGDDLEKVMGGPKP